MSEARPRLRPREGLSSFAAGDAVTDAGEDGGDGDGGGTADPEVWGSGRNDVFAGWPLLGLGVSEVAGCFNGRSRLRPGE